MLNFHLLVIVFLFPPSLVRFGCSPYFSNRKCDKAHNPNRTCKHTDLVHQSVVGIQHVCSPLRAKGGSEVPLLDVFICLTLFRKVKTT